MRNKISVSEVLLIHKKVIKQFGGVDGILSFGLLESAVVRMDTDVFGTNFYVSIFEKAAALFEALCKYHCFVDGNKRTAVVAVKVFFEKNDLKFQINPKVEEQFVVSVACGELQLFEIVEFFKQNVK